MSNNVRSQVQKCDVTHYIVTYDGWVAEFDINIKQAAPGCMESLNFFGDPIPRHDESDEAIIDAFLLLWCPVLCRESMDKSVSLLREWSNSQEGMLTLDGPKGITLTKCDKWIFDYYDFDIKKESV